MWTSPNSYGFLGITGHLVDSEWKLKSVLPDFVYVKGSHTGGTIARALMSALESLGIESKVVVLLSVFWNTAI